MEMTPVSLRDVSVSLGGGANTHGRETSSSSPEEATAMPATNAPVATQDNAKPEVPRDPRADAIAARLRMADPEMDARTAQQIAKTLLTPQPKWETAPVEGSPGHLDTSA
jgi:hypothetical protein